MLAVLFLNQITTKRRKNTQKIVNCQSIREDIYCRTCLSTENLVAIFYNKDTEQKRAEDLRLVTGLEIKMNDQLSQKICTGCIEVINNVLQFRKTSRKAEKTLLTMAYQSKLKKANTIELARNLKKRKLEKIEKIESNATNYNDTCDTYDNDNYEYEEDEVKEDSHIEKFSKPGPGKRRHGTIPNASSYKCNTCNKEFRMKATYKAHMRFHTNYCVCEACGKRCRNNNQLQEHKRARHGLGRIHKCAYCEYSSATKEALTIHERRHTGERPYICDHCGASFHRRSNLVQHIAIHLPEKNFQCDMCPKRLKSRKFLQIHKHNAHTGRRYGYLCGVCAHRFEKPNKVRAHSRRVHGLPDDRQGPIVRVQL